MVPTLCPRVKTLLAWSPGGSTHRIYPLRCKCWTCPVCWRKNLAHLIKQIEAQPPQRFITLTAKPQLLETPIACYNRSRAQIRRLFQLARERFGAQEYAVFCELHKSGFPHWHILQRGAFIPQAWLSSTWAKLTGAHIVDIRACNDKRGATRYVIKYVTKSSAHARLDKRYRIVTFSKHFRPPRTRSAPLVGWLLEFSRNHPTLHVEIAEKNHRVRWEKTYWECESNTVSQYIADAESLILFGPTNSAIKSLEKWQQKGATNATGIV